MDFKEKLLTQLLYNIIQILPVALEQWSGFIPKETYIPKTDVTFRPVDFSLELPEITPTWYHYSRNGSGSNREEQKSIPKLKFNEENQSGRKNKGPFRFGLKNRRIKKPEHIQRSKLRNKNKVGSTKNRMFNGNVYLKLDEELVHKLVDVKKILRNIKSLSRLGVNWKEQMGYFHQKFSSGLVNIILEILKNLKKEKNRRKQNADRKMEKENRIFGGSGFNRMNNVTYNNRYKIGAIFIINRLSEEKNSKLKEYKETEDEIFNDSTNREMKELLVQTLNNLNGDRISKVTEPDFFAHPLTKTQMSLMKKLEGNFLTRMFPYEKPTPEQLKKMSQIVDFVERYHGVFENLKGTNLSTKWKEDTNYSAAVRDKARRRKGERFRNFIRKMKEIVNRIDMCNSEIDKRVPLARNLVRNRNN